MSDRPTVTIFSLPNELLEAIAAAGQEDRIAELYSSYHDHRLDSYEKNLSFFKSEWTLSHVSRRFRDIILGASSLWTLIERSRSLKFSATLGLPGRYTTDPYGPGAALTQVVEHANRIKTLRIELKTASEVQRLRSSFANVSAPHLQRLEMAYFSKDWVHESEAVTVSVFSATPRLCFLKIHGSPLELPTAPWTALTHLELWRYSSDDDDPHNFEYFSAIIAKCPLLVHLRIHIFFEIDGSDQIHIPTLKFLHVWISEAGGDGDPRLLHTVNLFDTPALTEFVVEGTHGDQIYTFLNSTIVLRSSFPALTSFSFISEDCDWHTCDTDYVVDCAIPSPRSVPFRHSPLSP
ncbi:F-box domain-containing protein [Mycena sanguinolenta]|uniref:F-box domain-containing protein n=1 Tax=Mycena sanguinolenta TaxID=230812 RepID=A0A8H6YXV8_9AGAR|nr:F-box domain-containing protein [Mycena sanguinolenta]